MPYYLDSGSSRQYDQRSLTGNYKGAASDFGVCKAICVQWIKRWKTEHAYSNAKFFDGYLASSDATVRRKAEGDIMLLSRKEVPSIEEVVERQKADPELLKILERESKDWHLAYLGRSHIARTGEPISSRKAGKTLNETALAADVNATFGFSLLYFGGDKKHCIAIWSENGNNSGQMFDPNFGLFDIGKAYEGGHCWKDWAHIFHYLLIDYAKIFSDLGLPAPSRYRIEPFG